MFLKQLTQIHHKKDRKIMLLLHIFGTTKATIKLMVIFNHSVMGVPRKLVWAKLVLITIQGILMK